PLRARAPLRADPCPPRRGDPARRPRRRSGAPLAPRPRPRPARQRHHHHARLQRAGGRRARRRRAREGRLRARPGAGPGAQQGARPHRHGARRGRPHRTHRGDRGRGAPGPPRARSRGGGPMTSSSPDPEAPAAPEAPAVRVRGLSVDLPSLGRPYAAPLHAVRDLSFTAPTGQVIALVGANGAGKTTTLRTLLGAVPHTTGQVEVLGTAMGPADVPAPAGVALVPDAPAYPARWTPQHLARAHLARETQVDSARFDPARFDARLTAHRIPAARPLHSLSRGQLTQLALAAALARDPQLLILDEPFAHLDPLA